MKVAIVWKYTLLLVVLLIFSILILKNYVVEKTDITDKNVKIVKNYTENIVRINQNIYSNNKYSWNSESTSNSWNYMNGFMMYALLKTNKYNNFVDSFYNKVITDDGKINSRDNVANKYVEYSLDSIQPASNLFNLPNRDKYKKNIQYVYSQIEKQPVLNNCGNNYVHKYNNPNWYMYPFALDGLYMSSLFLLNYDKSQEMQMAVFNRLKWVNDNLRFSDTGLYSHGVRADGTTLNNVVWLRSVGWYAMTQVEVLDYISNENLLNILKKDLANFLDAMLKYQDKKTGMWRNIISDKYVSCNKYETSGSLMLAYALMKAYVEGYVEDSKYGEAGLYAFNGVIINKLRKIDNNYTLIDIYRQARVYDLPQAYCNSNLYVQDEAKGVAPLILASQYAILTKDKLLQNGVVIRTPQDEFFRYFLDCVK